MLAIPASVASNENILAICVVLATEGCAPLFQELCLILDLISLDASRRVRAVRYAFMMNDLRMRSVKRAKSILPNLKRQIDVFAICRHVALVEAAQFFPQRFGN